jgi:hypothetical protein
MLEVGCPEPALVLARIESTRSWAASSATVARLTRDMTVVVVTVAPGERAVSKFPLAGGVGRQQLGGAEARWASPSAAVLARCQLESCSSR